MSLTDLLIATATIVFVMSTISERISNFLKLYFQDKIIYIPVISRNDNGKWVFLLKARLRILAEKQITEAAEKEREYRILVINIIVGILSAAFININIFELFAVKDINGLQLHLGWTTDKLRSCEVIVGALYLFLFIWSSSIILFSKLYENTRKSNQRDLYIPFFCWLAFTFFLFLFTLFKQSTNVWAGKILLHFGGYLTMGVFLSLGSKFWHDLLDILFSFKRTQEKLSDPKLLTDFNSADQIIKYTEITQYDIAEKLYENYRSKLWAIEGVVSCGLITYFDERVRLYQKRIEVEFTTNKAQDQLIKMRAEGEVQINYNTFFLKDYLEIKFTKELIAVPDIGIGTRPVCYARNNAASNEDIKGSFNVKKTTGGYIAFGCLHVFASERDFNQFKNSEKSVIIDKEVLFSINGVQGTGNILPESILFGDQSGSYGADYCECSIDEETYNQYIEFIKKFKLDHIEDHQINLFGATSKFLSLKEPEHGLVECKIGYGQNFEKTLHLFKINALGPDKNIEPGDSGASVYYKSDDSTKYCLGMIVAKSENCAYMFKLNKISIPETCKPII